MSGVMSDDEIRELLTLHWSIRAIAARVGVAPNTMSRRIRKHGLDRPKVDAC